MTLEFELFDRGQADGLAVFLAADDWRFHAGGRPTVDEVREQVAQGTYDGAATRTFWIVDDGAVVGTVRLDDLEDDTPLFDLRPAKSARGRGVGTAAVRWLTEHLFAERPQTLQIEATTRRDNLAMRRVLRRCGYAKESHWRKAWPDADGDLHDGIGYGILRGDWETGTSTPVDWDDEPA